ncbi:hypothetical protein QUA32_02190 [Microcoleus sp. Pol14D6]
MWMNGGLQWPRNRESNEPLTPQLPEAIRIAISTLCRSSHHISMQMNR